MVPGAGVPTARAGELVHVKITMQGLPVKSSLNIVGVTFAVGGWWCGRVVMLAGTVGAVEWCPL